ncbi:preprotein translocase subunit SecG [Hydrogenothermus marinus]|uniref:Protein-export membrane protein SecG n=1 Tax=Hydrogenothermus marinus TaxID=133270 RepID=A0A3M0BJ30_9AQUI|nr:preprotein translocase subunit SecG [Hydrogenothermus marinus]RMA97167.1 protein translocase subunit secG [Hydrogenothermus marinus]
MELLYTILSILLIIDGILLVILILMQKTKGAEIGAVFGSGAAAAVLGAGASNFLTKLTYWLGGIFLAIVLTLSLIDHYKHKPKFTDIPANLPVKTEKK